ncbi:MAG: hypothetical protein NDI91_00055 [Sulfuritalea sp.]|nr:hypothetical protein [Sulfuritalea sp.]
MNLLRKIIARFIELLVERLHRDFGQDLEQRLRLYFLDLNARLDTLERALVPPFLATVLKNEMQNLDCLPMRLLEDLKELTVVGYYAEDLKAILPTCQVASFPDWLESRETIRMEASFYNLLFLDEYYFMRTMERLLPSAVQVADTIMVATRFAYLPEERCRTILHQLGYMEIVLVTVDSLTGELATWAVSHARPITCDPLFIDQRRPVTEPESPIIWLIARKAAMYGNPEWPNA